MADPQMYDSGYDRKRLDRYWTSPWCPIWEPACGRGDITKVLIKAGFNTISSDIDISEFEVEGIKAYELDFLQDAPMMDAQSLVTNPPYNRMAPKFVKRMLMLMEEGDLQFGAMLLRSEFNSGKTRGELFGDCEHYAAELVLTTRPRWDMDDPDRPEDAHPRHNYSWFIWLKGWREENDPIQLFSYMPKGFKP
jgi:hypothetical protein